MQLWALSTDECSDSKEPYHFADFFVNAMYVIGLFCTSRQIIKNKMELHDGAEAGFLKELNTRVVFAEQTIAFNSMILVALLLYYAGAVLSWLHFDEHFVCEEDHYRATTNVGHAFNCLRYCSAFLLAYCVDFYFYFGHALQDRPAGFNLKSSISPVDINMPKSPYMHTDYLKNEYIY